jgi:hypothetical protein
MSSRIEITRRNVVTGLARLGLLGVATKAGHTQTARVQPRSSATACIFINLDGAPSHVDTFDVKEGSWLPDDFKAQQVASGVVLSQTLFPGISRIGGDLCILRSVTSWEAAHDRGQFYLQTAHPSNPAFVAETPHLGAVIGYEKGATSLLPPFLSLNAQSVQGAKFLGGVYEPFTPPLDPGGLPTLRHDFFGNQSQSRFQDRYALLKTLNTGIADPYLDAGMAAQSAFFDTAHRMMYQDALSNVFKFNSDDDRRYGSTSFGRSCIIARNAVQVAQGARFITIDFSGWDTHSGMYDRSTTGNMYQLCNTLDRGVSELASDLRLSGDLRSTLIVAMGEFGRTPGQLNPRGGRDHHREAMSVLMLGGGVRGGRAIGATDIAGDQVITPGWSQERPIYFEDVAATIYSALGIDWTKSIANTPSGRKFEYVSRAATGSYLPVDEVFK